MRIKNTLNEIFDREFTFRELLVSISIISVMLIVGLIISNKISAAHEERYRNYETALQIEDNAEYFQYAVRTSVGNILAYGEVKTVDTVGMDGYVGDYCYIEREEQHYNKHIRTVTHTDEDGNTYTTEQIYYSWDHFRTDSISSTTVSFLGGTYPKELFYYDGLREIDTVKFSSSKRYKYRVIDGTVKGTLCTFADNKELTNCNFFRDRTIETVLNANKINVGLIFFWIMYSIAIISAVYFFVTMENDWLNLG